MPVYTEIPRPSVPTYTDIEKPGFVTDFVFMDGVNYVFQDGIQKVFSALSDMYTEIPKPS